MNIFPWILLIFSYFKPYLLNIKLLEKFPRVEQYGLSAQMKRSAISIPSNVAEGFRRRHNREYKQFLNIALGSTAELETQIIIAKELGYINTNREEELIAAMNHLCGMIVNLMKLL